MRKLLPILFVLACLVPAVQAQDEGTREEIRPVQYYVGFQPGLDLIPFDEFGRYAFDINVLPFTIEYAINTHWALRIHSIWDIQVRPEFPTVFSKAGVEITVPYYLPRKNSEEGHRGLYVAGLIKPVYHRLNQYYSTSVGAEAGYAFLFGNGWSIALAAQAGLEFQKEPDYRFIRTLQYLAPRISIGRWL